MSAAACVDKYGVRTHEFDVYFSMLCKEEGLNSRGGVSAAEGRLRVTGGGRGTDQWSGRVQEVGMETAVADASMMEIR